MQPDESGPATGLQRFKMGQWIRCAPFEKRLHIDIIEDDDRAVLEMPFLIEFAQGAGLVYGGALVG